MHEYSVVAELVSSLLPQLDGHPGRVKAVILMKGDLRILSARALANAFEILAAGTRLEGSELVVEPVSSRVKCRSCDYEGAAEYHKDDEYHFVVPVLTCPECQGEVDIVSGRELYVDRVSMEVPAEADDSEDGEAEPSQDGSPSTKDGGAVHGG